MSGAAPPTRGLRNAGNVACLLGTLVMICGRFMHGAPSWLIYVGLGGIAFGWGLFGYSVVQRAVVRRSQKPRSDIPSAKS
jgi:1,4-dihydroxy-2-naphthoate octaprenyltransferase